MGNKFKKILKKIKENDIISTLSPEAKLVYEAIQEEIKRDSNYIFIEKKDIRKRTNLNYYRINKAYKELLEKKLLVYFLDNCEHKATLKEEIKNKMIVISLKYIRNVGDNDEKL